MVPVDEVVETKYPPGDKVSTDPTGCTELLFSGTLSQHYQANAGG